MGEKSKLDRKTMLQMIYRYFYCFVGLMLMIGCMCEGKIRVCAQEEISENNVYQTVEILEEEYIYIDSNISYEVEHEQFRLDKAEYNLRVDYPKLRLKDETIQNELNDVIYKCAFRSLDLMYPTYQLDKKLNSGYLKCEVDYQITYMKEDLICIAFIDHYFMGDIVLEFTDYRSVVLNPMTGEVYTISDVLKEEDACFTDIQNIILEQNPNFDPAVVNLETIQKSWHYSDIMNRFHSDLMVLNYGIGIVFTYHYNDQHILTRGFMTIEDEEGNYGRYKTDSEFWKLYNPMVDEKPFVAPKEEAEKNVDPDYENALRTLGLGENFDPSKYNIKPYQYDKDMTFTPSLITPQEKKETASKDLENQKPSEAVIIKEKLEQCQKVFNDTLSLFTKLFEELNIVP